MKKSQCKFWSFFIILATVFCSCFGCSVKDAESNGDDNNLEERILSRDCKIIYPSDVDAELFAKIQGLQADIATLGGITLELSDDYLPSGNTTVSSSAQEIIIGNTSRDESRELMENIGYFDYAVRYIGNKLVVAAHTEKMLYAAISEFSEKMLTLSENGIVIGDDISFKGEQGFFEKYGELSRYRIVYPEGNSNLREVAENLSTKIQKRYSVGLPVVSDGEAPNGYELLIGATNRAVFADYYRGNKKPDALHYAICAREGNLLIYGGNDRATDVACMRLLSDRESAFWTFRFEMPCDIDELSVAYDYTDADAARHDGTDVRIMSYNILSEELSPDKADFEVRAELVLSTVLNYAPDVVGIQEVSEGAYEIMEKYVGEKYAFPLKKTPTGAYSYTSLMYNKETVNYIEGDNYVYSVGNKRIRIISWGLFEMKSSGQRFIAVSTHWDIVLDNRPIQAAEMTTFVNNLVEKYKCPVFTTGDFNTLDSVPYYQTYLERTNQGDARYKADTVGAQASGDVIDHITFSTDNAYALFYKHVITELSAKASDHNPVYADFKFIK